MHCLYACLASLAAGILGGGYLSYRYAAHVYAKAQAVAGVVQDAAKKL